MVTPGEGRAAVELARRSIRDHLSREGGDAGPPVVLPADLPPVFRERRGAFVTLKRWPGHELRGCIGFPLPVLPLGTALVEAGVAAATDDPRFPPMRASELPHVSVEVSILTPPEPLPAGGRASRVDAVRVGRDGLIVEGHGSSGLLLPQVATEQGWDAEKFLRETCRKAGLPSNAWEDPRVRVLRFRAEVFAELRPEGPVEPEGPVTPGGEAGA